MSLSRDHQRFLEKYTLPDAHYSYEDCPLLYFKHSKEVTKEHLDKAITDPNTDSRVAAASNHTATKEHLDKAVNDRSEAVRAAAVSKPNATKEHLDKVKHDFYLVKSAAKRNPNYDKYFPNEH